MDGKDLEGNGRDLFESNILAIAWRDWEYSVLLDMALRLLFKERRKSHRLCEELPSKDTETWL
jgi:hypothetical protein